MAAAEPVLKLEGINAGYGPIAALRDVSLTVNRGEIVTMIGANGAGKTTTLMCCSAVHRIRSGRIIFEDREIHAMPPHRLPALGLAQVPEGRKIFPRLTVLENLELGAFTRSDHQEIRSDLEKVFSLFEILGERKAQQAGTLSGGEQQMLAIGRALMSRPRLLLLDEPSMGVAPILTAKIFETLAELNRAGMTILLVEQNAHLALKLAHRAYVMETGQIVMVNEAKVLLQDPAVREAYLGEG